MNFEEFVNGIKESIRDYLPKEYENAEVLVQEQQKLNNRYTGLLVLREGGIITPTVNLEQLFDYYNSRPEMSIYDVMKETSSIIQMEQPGLNMEGILQYDLAKEKLFMRVSSAEKNEDLLQHVPHELKEDLAITFHLVVEECTEGFTQEVKEKIYSFLQSHEKKRYPNKEQKQRLEFWQKFFENGHYERSWESGMEVNYDAIDGCVNHQKDDPGKALKEPKDQPARPRKKTSVIRKLHQKQIAIAKRSGKPIPRYLEQQMVREKV